MNIFALDPDPYVAAQYLCDRHIVKMALETAQLMSTALVAHGVNHARLYRPTHTRHPCTLWTADARSNFVWLGFHGIGICREYTLRYGKTHASEAIIREAMDLHRHIPDVIGAKFAQAMPDKYKRADSVDAYRAYYIGDKARFATWRAPRTAPPWWPSDLATQLH